MTNVRCITAAELVAELERFAREHPWWPAKREAEYRRGYCDGFIEAVNAMADLFARGLSKQAICDRLYDHWEGDLAAWQGGDCSKMALPPRVALKKGRQGMTPCPMPMRLYPKSEVMAR